MVLYNNPPGNPFGMIEEDGPDKFIGGRISRVDVFEFVEFESLSKLKFLGGGNILYIMLYILEIILYFKILHQII